LTVYEDQRAISAKEPNWACRFALLFICCVLWHTTGVAGAQENRRVLVLYQLGRSSAPSTAVDREIREVLEKQTTYHIDLYAEYMETDLFVEPASQQKILDWYLEKYRVHQPDIIIAVGGAPIRFMLREHDKNFPGVPTVICGSMEDFTNSPGLGPEFTGTWMYSNAAKTLDVALKLQPGTEEVLVVNGASSFDKLLETSFRTELQSYEGRLKLTYLSGLSMSSLLLRLRHAPNHSIILFGSIGQDGTGRRFDSASQSLPMILAAASVPTYVARDVLVGQGSVGGYVMSYAGQGRVAAEDVMKILGGEKPQNIPIVKGDDLYLFDWRALQHWDLEEHGLPTGSIVINRQPTLIEAYGRYVFAGLIVLFAQLLLILQLLSQRAKERTIRRYLHESEARLREAQSIAQCGSWVWDIRVDKMHWSDEMYRILGMVPQSVPADRRLAHPENSEHYAAEMRQAADTHQPYSAEYRIVRPNGEERIVLESGYTKYDSQQKPISMIGTMLDVTEHRQAEQVLRESEERFRTMADGAPIMMWISDTTKLCTDFNRGWLLFTGRAIEEELGNGWAEGVHPDDLQRCLAIYNEAFDERQFFSMEYRLRRHDGQYRWIIDDGSPRFLADGSFAGYIGCCFDIHDRKEADLARLELARRLMGAQEAERSRIARELHDGIGQEIALLSIQMQRASASKKSVMEEFSNKLSKIGVHVGRLSHQLHSSELEFLGLAVAITKLCREFSEEYPIALTCACRNIPRELNNDIALTFLRIVQEALHNVAKHSGAKTVQVEVDGTEEELSLSVCDDGSGFDVRATKASAGLGLISMRERIYLLAGEFTIEATPNVGTCIRARAPLTRLKSFILVE
jgi:PAS domain S-box-containing protein